MSNANPAKFFIPKPDVTDQQSAKPDSFALYQSGAEMLKWSAPFPLPNVGDRVYILLNSIRWATVKGYFSEAGFLGCMTLAENPPEWLRKQRKREEKSDRDQPQWVRDGIGCEFGAELSLTEPARRKRV